MFCVKSSVKLSKRNNENDNTEISFVLVLISAECITSIGRIKTTLYVSQSVSESVT